MVYINKVMRLAIISTLCCIAFTGCTLKNLAEKQVVKSSSLSSKINKQELTPIDIKDIEFVNGKIIRYSEDYKAIEAEIKNNSSLTITEVYFDFKLDNGNTSNLGYYETLKPGEISSKKECEAPTTGKAKDIIFNSAIIRAVDGTNEIEIVYNGKTNEYSITRNKIDETLKPDVSITEIELINPELKELDSKGTRYFEAKLKNNSKKTITSIVIYYDIGNGENSTLSTFETLAPGETSSKEICVGPEDGNIENMKINTITITAFNSKDQEVSIEYDAKLDQYHISK